MRRRPRCRPRTDAASCRFRPGRQACYRPSRITAHFQPDRVRSLPECSGSSTPCVLFRRRPRRSRRKTDPGAVPGSSAAGHHGLVAACTRWNGHRETIRVASQKRWRVIDTAAAVRAWCRRRRSHGLRGWRRRLIWFHPATRWAWNLFRDRRRAFSACLLSCCPAAARSKPGFLLCRPGRRRRIMPGYRLRLPRLVHSKDS